MSEFFLDDSHACIESIKNSLSIRIPSNHKELYDRIKNLFEDDLREQGEGSIYELDNQHSDIVMPIPYWCWLEKNSQVAKILSGHFLKKKRDRWINMVIGSKKNTEKLV